MFNDSKGNLILNGGVNITGGLTSDSVLFNVDKTNDITVNTGGATISGIILDPGGLISISDSNLIGRVYGGEQGNIQIGGGSTINGANVPEPSTLALGTTIVAGLVCWGFFKKQREKSRVKEYSK